jgi:hypothetical protein
MEVQSVFLFKKRLLEDVNGKGRLAQATSYIYLMMLFTTSMISFIIFQVILEGGKYALSTVIDVPIWILFVYLPLSLFLKKTSSPIKKGQYLVGFFLRIASFVAILLHMYLGDQSWTIAIYAAIIVLFWLSFFLKNKINVWV